MMLIAAMMLVQAAGAAAPPPGAEAEALGLRLARSGTLATVLPAMAKADGEALVAAHPELEPAERERLRAVAAEVARAGLDRIEAAFGHAYAQALTLAELRTLVAQIESPAQARFRAILPRAMAAAAGTLGSVDVKKDALARFCRETGKLCPAQDPES